MFAHVFECSKCGDVWDVEFIDDIDTDRDEVETVAVCKCGRMVWPKLVDGRPVYHVLSEDEMDAECTGNWGDDEPLDDAFDHVTTMGTAARRLVSSL